MTYIHTWVPGNVTCHVTLNAKYVHDRQLAALVSDNIMIGGAVKRIAFVGKQCQTMRSREEHVPL